VERPNSVGLKPLLTQIIDKKRLVSYTLCVGDYNELSTDKGSFRSPLTNPLNEGGTENEYKSDHKYAGG
jgi:hypothetical protein